MTSIFTLGVPTQARFGEGARRELPALLGPAPRILLVATAGAAARAPDVVAALAGAGDLAVWSKVQPNPRIGDIDACLAAHGASGVTHVVGLGGGSALDQAKATAMALDLGKPVRELLALKALPARRNRLILAPTTSGTGAELSYGAILTDEISGEKLGLRGRTLAADDAVIDPELTYSQPVDVTMTTGFDVLTHALETHLSSAASPYTETLSRAAVERVFAFLPRLRTAPGDVEARREMAFASMIMGINLALSTTCLPHRLQYPVGAATDTAHAAGLAALYPAWLAHVRPSAVDRLARCAEWIGAAAAGTPREAAAAAFEKATIALLREIGLTPSLADLGVDREMCAGFAAQVSGRLDTDPGYRSIEDVRAIYAAAFERPLAPA